MRDTGVRLYYSEGRTKRKVSIVCRTLNVLGNTRHDFRIVRVVVELVYYRGGDLDSGFRDFDVLEGGELMGQGRQCDSNRDRYASSCRTDY